MRPLEIALATSLCAYALSPLFPARIAGWCLGAIALLVLAIATAHVKVEGPRWQMYPMYALVFFVVIGEGARLVSGYRPGLLVGFGTAIVLASGVFLSTVLPVLSLPAPTGAHRIGTHTAVVVDAKRRDPFSDKQDQPREIVVQFWYPAEAPTDGDRTPYRDPRTTTLWNARYALARTHAMSGAPLARSRERYPVVFYTHSWHGIRSEATVHVEELASHGYVVVAIDHPFSSLITAFPDGRLAHTKLNVPIDYSTPETFKAFLEAADQQVATRAEDARSVLDNISEAGGSLAGHLDLDHVGIFGFSLGGSVAAQACWLEPRFKACADLDGLVAAQSATEGTRAPFMYLTADDPRQRVIQPTPGQARERQYDVDQLSLVQRSLERTGGYWVHWQSLEHADFSDAPFFSPLRSISHTSSEAGLGTTRTIGHYLLAFFDKYLKGDEPSWLDGATNELTGVRVQTWKPHGD